MAFQPLTPHPHLPPLLDPPIPPPRCRRRPPRPFLRPASPALSRSPVPCPLRAPGLPSERRTVWRRAPPSGRTTRGRGPPASPHHRPAGSREAHVRSRSSRQLRGPPASPHARDICTGCYKLDPYTQVTGPPLAPRKPPQPCPMPYRPLALPVVSTHPPTLPPWVQGRCRNIPAAPPRLDEPPVAPLHAGGQRGRPPLALQGGVEGGEG